MSEKTNALTPERNERGQFIMGHTGAGGRPVGARNKLGEAFIQALHDSFNEHGAATIETVRVEKPDQYLKVIASLLPKDVNLNLNDNLGELSDDELLGEIRKLYASLAPFIAEGAGAASGAEQSTKLH